MENELTEFNYEKSTCQYAQLGYRILKIWNENKEYIELDKTAVQGELFAEMQFSTENINFDGAKKESDLIDWIIAPD